MSLTLGLVVGGVGGFYLGMWYKQREYDGEKEKKELKEFSDWKKNKRKNKR